MRMQANVSTSKSDTPGRFYSEIGSQENARNLYLQSCLGSPCEMGRVYRLSTWRGDDGDTHSP
jgi:hypothetical protein